MSEEKNEGVVDVVAEQPSDEPVGEQEQEPAQEQAQEMTVPDAEQPPADEEAQPKVADPQLKAVIEALVFASPDPLTLKMLFKLMESEPKEDVELALSSLMADYDARGGGLQLVEVANGYQIVTRPEMHEWVRRLFHERKTQKLSVQALETLAVIAYKQPITVPEINEIRGVNTGGVINTLLERHLIKISGRKAVIGRPFLYSTTREFLIRFGLKDLEDLPKVEDLADVLGFMAPALDGPAEARLPLEAESEQATENGEQPASDFAAGSDDIEAASDGEEEAASDDVEEASDAVEAGSEEPEESTEDLDAESEDDSAPEEQVH